MDGKITQIFSLIGPKVQYVFRSQHGTHIIQYSLLVKVASNLHLLDQYGNQNAVILQYSISRFGDNSSFASNVRNSVDIGEIICTQNFCTIGKAYQKRNAWKWLRAYLFL